MAVRVVLVVELDGRGVHTDDELQAYGEAVVAEVLAETGAKTCSFEWDRAQIRAARIERD